MQFECIIGVGFMVQGLGFRVGSRFRVQAIGFKL